MLSNPSAPADVVVLIATADRPLLLQSRALRSVAHQLLAPSRVVVVDDSRTRRHQASVRSICRHFGRSGVPVEWLRNRRTPGACGAWNTGLDHLARSVDEPSRTIVALLDDDDAWAPEHLQRLHEAFTASPSVEVVASSFRRLEEDRDPRIVHPPSSLDAKDFLVGNPGVQPSATGMLLSTVLQAGCFDEALASCTDRDLFVRLADLGAGYEAREHVTADHYACRSRARLCSPGSAERQSGLDEWWHKHGPRMSPEERNACAERARRYFGWNPPQPRTPARRPVDLPMAESARLSAPLGIVVGFIADVLRTTNVAHLLDDLLELSHEPGLAGLDVVVLENGEGQGAAPRLREVVESARDRGLRIYFVDRDRHLVDARQGHVSDGGVSQGTRLAIAPARTVLQSYLYAFARKHPGAVVWILDDDMRLDPLLVTDKGLLRSRCPIVPQLQQLKRLGADIVIGRNTGAAPLPFASTLRCQLVDLLATLHVLASIDPSAPMPSADARHAALRADRRDYYYDLSRSETDRLESPFVATPKEPDELAAAVFERISSQAYRILAGEQLSRPLVVEPGEDDSALVGDGLFRGGNTLVFDLNALADAPNPAPVIEGRPTRRSDMLWSLLQRHRFGRSVVSVPFAVHHDRSATPVGALDVDCLVDDIRGYAMISTLRDLEGEQEVDVGARVRKCVEERLAALRLSWWRVGGVLRSIRRALDRSWLASPSYAQARQRLRDFCDQVQVRVTLKQLAQIERGARALGPSEFETFRRQLDAMIEEHAERLRDPTALDEAFAAQRVINARHTAQHLASMSVEATVLGAGAEAVVFTDGVEVYKVFDYWKARASHKQRAFLRELVDRWPDARALYPLHSFHENSTWAVLVYPYESSEPYRGGHGPGLVDLLVECHRNGIACRNIHPSNLRVVGERVRLVDYGSDLVPATDAELAMMCRRAWLTWRWWFRPDLKSLMTKALRDTTLPELDGAQRLLWAVRRALGLERVDDPVLRLAMARQYSRVLDYGCGKGALAAVLAREGAEVVAYDPDPGLEARLEQLVSPRLRATRHRDEVFADGPFDLVLCQRVACTITDERELEMVAADLRRAVSDSGSVLLTVCHPAYACCSTPEATGHPLANADPERTYEWHKTVRSTGRRRLDVHRPERVLRRILARAGLKVVGRHESNTVDTERFEPASDLLVLELVPLPPRPEVSLMIKACAMEANTLEVQVRHLISQLEFPGAFAERILVLDGRKDDFLRQHTRGSLEALHRVAKGLQERGWIDRVVEGPTDESTCASLTQSWFGCSATSGYAVTGAQVASTLAGFEACKTEYVLQADADVMIGRADSEHDVVADMLDAMRSDPKAVTVAFNIASAADRPYAAHGPEGPWRTEVRICLLCLPRLRGLRPLPNAVTEERLDWPWHRALDRVVASGVARSLRGGDRRTFYVHPPNAKKTDRDAWWSVLDKVERSRVPSVQVSRVEWTGTAEQWRMPQRFEPFVFVICGRNVPPGRFRRCLESVLQQRHRRWGAVVIDDGSTPAWAWELEQRCRPHLERISVVQTRQRRGLLPNMITAIRDYCGDPSSVIVTLDADDALLGCTVLDRLAREYEAGADATIGSMLRTDKHRRYPVTLEEPRRNRGGNVWQHLRSFRKALFDAIPDEQLRLDGEYIDLANDWAYMLPIVELARRPVHVLDPLYLHEPSGSGKHLHRSTRDSIISRLVARPSVTTEAPR